MLQKWAIANFSDFHHEIWADDQAPVCNMYVTLLHVIIWDSTTMYVCRHNTSTIFSSCSPKTISVNVTKSFWIPSDILLFSFLRPLLCYAMLCCDMCMLYLSLDMHMLHSGNCLGTKGRKSDESPLSQSCGVQNRTMN